MDRSAALTVTRLPELLTRPGRLLSCRCRCSPAAPRLPTARTHGQAIPIPAEAGSTSSAAGSRQRSQAPGPPVTAPTPTRGCSELGHAPLPARGSHVQRLPAAGRAAAAQTPSKGAGLRADRPLEVQGSAAIQVTPRGSRPGRRRGAGAAKGQSVGRAGVPEARGVRAPLPGQPPQPGSGSGRTGPRQPLGGRGALTPGRDPPAGAAVDSRGR